MTNDALSDKLEEMLPEGFADRLKDPKVLVALLIAGVGLGLFVGFKLAGGMPQDGSDSPHTTWADGVIIEGHAVPYETEFFEPRAHNEEPVEQAPPVYDIPGEELS